VARVPQSCATFAEKEVTANSLIVRRRRGRICLKKPGELWKASVKC